MPGKKNLAGKASCLFPAWLCTLSLFAQDPFYLSDRVEEAMDRREEAVLNAGEQACLEELEERPLDLNTAGRQELETCGLFTPYQVHRLLEYRDTYGPLISIYELASIEGFSTSRVKAISGYLAAGQDRAAPQWAKESARISLFACTSFPRPEGFLGDPGRQAYAGSPWRAGLRAQTGLGKQSTVAIAFEKDAGERAWSGNSPEYLGGYYRYRGNRVLDQLVVGNFMMKNGMGLVNGSGQFNASQGLLSEPAGISSLRAYSGTGETGALRGLACRLNLRPFRISLWSSLQPMDLSATLADDDPREPDLPAHMRTSGLHRTRGECEGRGLAYLGDAGAQILLEKEGLVVGVHVSSSFSGLTARGRDSLELSPGPFWKPAAGITWRWQRGRFRAFGEYVPGPWNRSAALAGTSYVFSDFLSGSLMLHHYGMTYAAPFSMAYASGSRVSNEDGLTIVLHAEVARGVTADCLAALFNYPGPRYYSCVPSSGSRFNLTLSNNTSERTQWRFQLVRKYQEQTPAQERSGVSPLSGNHLTRLDGRLVFIPGANLQFQSRLVLSATERPFRDPGYAALAQARMAAGRRLVTTVQFVVFDIPDWDARVYLYEPGLYHQFSFPAYYGSGQKATVLFALRICRKCTCEVRISGISYFDRDRIGSGHEQVLGNRELNAAFQLRLDF
jgi:hypothetical protein